MTRLRGPSRRQELGPPWWFWPWVVLSIGIGVPLMYSIAQGCRPWQNGVQCVLGLNR